MQSFRPAESRGHFDHGWLNTYHSFSFGDYRDPEHDGFSVLRVINEDRVRAGQGFGAHPHEDMEILTYVIAGALQHRDSMGNGSIIRPGDVQRMSAGSGVTHSEFNPSPEEPVHFLQIWILPEAKDIAPSYEQKRFGPSEMRNALRLIASRDGREGSITWHQDASLFVSHLLPGRTLQHGLAPHRKAWVQVVRGSLNANGQRLTAGDGLGVNGDRELLLTAGGTTELLLFDLP